MIELHTEPVVEWARPDRRDQPLVVLLHGRHEDEQQILTIADSLPDELSCAALRGPIAEDKGFSWYVNEGPGRPTPDSLAPALEWGREVLEEFVEPGRPVVLAGFSAGAQFASGLVLSEPERYAGAALMCGPIPFDTDVPVEAGRLDGLPVFVAQGDHDVAIPRDLLEETWEYVQGESGAVATGFFDDFGHEVSDSTVAALADWMEDLVV